MARNKAPYNRNQAKIKAQHDIGLVAIEAQQDWEKEDLEDARIFQLENSGVIRFQGESDRDRASREAYTLFNRPGNGTTWI